MQHRLATDSDFDFIYRIYMDKEANKYLTYDPMDEKPFAAVYAGLLASNTLFVVEDGERLIGTYRLIPKQFRQAHTVYLGSFGIDPSLKGKGYGYAVLKGIREEAMRRGWSRIELTVDLDNQAAVHLYQKAGFEIEGIIRNSYKRSTTNRFYNEYMMAWLLPETPMAK
jgi:RimJ/RimL family protein N-acetyltransferase